MSFDLHLIDGDIKVQPDGKIKIIVGTPKLRQDILKIILTPIGESKYHRWYGCTISDDIVGATVPPGMIVQEINIAITESLDNLKRLQQIQSSYQDVKLSEILDSIEYVDVGRNVSDPRQVNVVVSVLSKKLEKIDEVFSITS